MKQKDLDAALVARFRQGLVARAADEDDYAYSPYLQAEQAIVDGLTDIRYPDVPPNPLVVATAGIVAASAARAWIRSCWESRSSESPLEETFLLALIAVGTMHTDGKVLYDSCINGEHKAEPVHAPSQLAICQQHGLFGGYRADFLLTSYEYFGGPGVERGASLVVECDGHDYHERTKEQARSCATPGPRSSPIRSSARAKLSPPYSRLDANCERGELING